MFLIMPIHTSGVPSGRLSVQSQSSNLAPADLSHSCRELSDPHLRLLALKSHSSTALEWAASWKKIQITRQLCRTTMRSGRDGQMATLQTVTSPELPWPELEQQVHAALGSAIEREPLRQAPKFPGQEQRWAEHINSLCPPLPVMYTCSGRQHTK
jgi:hypothetical protein